MAAAILLAGFSAAGAQEAARPAKSSRTVTTAAYPLLLYAPEFSLMFGGGAVMVIRREGAAPETKPNNITLNAMYTLKNQTVLMLTPEFYSKNEKLKFRATVLYQDMPTSFFGIGNSGSLKYDDITAREETYTNRTFIFQPQFTHKVLGRLRAGLSYDFKSAGLSKLTTGGRLASGAVNGTSGGTLSGLGAMLDYDSRDNLFSPSRGVFAQAVVRCYRGAFGSDYEYDYRAVDLRAYRGLGAGGVLGFQLAGVAAGKGVPFYDLPLYDLRGIYNTYFADRAGYFGQAEYRFPLSGRFSATVFAGAGNTAPTARELSFENPQFAAGSGLRFVLDKEERINMRLDIGASRWGVQPYFGITEAF